MFMVAGPVRYKVQAEHSTHFTQRVIVRNRHKVPSTERLTPEERPHIATIYQWLVENRIRNEEITHDVAACVKQGAHCLLLTERREHAEILANLLSDAGISTAVLRGGMGVKERSKVEAKLHDAQVVVATGKYIGEGFDLPPTGYAVPGLTHRLERDVSAIRWPDTSRGRWQMANSK